MVKRLLSLGRPQPRQVQQDALWAGQAWGGCVEDLVADRCRGPGAGHSICERGVLWEPARGWDSAGVEWASGGEILRLRKRSG